MNRESLYLEIGGIDDDLIEEAAQPQRRQRRRGAVIARWGSLAACLCLLGTAMLFGMRRDIVKVNELDAKLNTKVMIPAEATAVSLTESALWEYYGMEPLPDMLSGMSKSEDGLYALYRYEQSVVYDTNTVYYASADGACSLTVTIATEERTYPMWGQEAKPSRLAGVSLVLGRSDAVTPVYWAELCVDGISLRAVSRGMEESSFVDAMREIIRSQKG